jgi:hypothetical protein
VIVLVRHPYARRSDAPAVSARRTLPPVATVGLRAIGGGLSFAAHV